MTNYPILNSFQMDNEILNDRYQICEKLSAKPGRRVYQAQDLQSGALVIIKVLLFHPGFKWQEYELFERELQTLRNLDHPAIPKYLDNFDVSIDNYPGFALVQTYIDAPSLQSWLEQGRKFSEQELVELADKALSILGHLHRQNPPILHRDVKPSNLLLTNRSGNSIGEIYLVDFGCAQVTHETDGTITVVGSYGYTPFEQYAGEAVPASDIYSLGMTIIYLATGVHPAKLPKVNGKYQIKIPHLSKGLQRWLEKKIEPNLEKRFSSARIAQEFLESNNILLEYYDSKPKHSNIELNDNYDHIEILLAKVKKLSFLSFIFPQDLWWNLGSFLVPATILFPWILPFLENFIVKFANTLNISATSGTFWAFTSYFLLVCLCCYFVSSIREIRRQAIDRNSIKKIIIDDNKISAFTFSNVVVFDNLRSDIALLAYYPSYEFEEFFDYTGRHHNRGKVVTKAELLIHAGSNKYSIKNLAPNEFLWLGKILSEILGLDLQVIYPTPKVPPEPSA